MRACGLQCRTDLAAELVEYLYTGSIAIPMQRATELLSLADRWQIRGGTPVAIQKALSTILQTTPNALYWVKPGTELA